MILLALLVTGAAANAVDRPQADRDGKLFSVFQIVRFQNGECKGATGDIGACFTDAECRTKGGKSDGNCASGFGVCCTAALGGATDKCKNKDILVKLNNTRLESPGFPSTVLQSGCTSNVARSEYRQAAVASGPPAPYLYDIQKYSADVKQIRLDFLTFEIDAPAEGVCGNGTGLSFVGVDSTSTHPTNLCGNLTGQSIYLPVTNVAVNGNITVKIQIGAYGAQKWNVRVVYLDSADDLAPRGCLQYMRGEAGTIKSFNNGKGLLADSMYNICFKELAGKCDIAFTSTAFAMGGTSGACTATGNKLVIGAMTYCGTTFGTGGMATSMATAVSVMTGSTIAAADTGFELSYMSLPCAK